MAIYLDAVDVGGLTRTGLEVFPSGEVPTGAGPVSHNTTGYAYVDTLILWSVRKACNEGKADAADCAAASALLEARRAQHPYMRWNDGYGRSMDWPPVKLPLNG